MLRNVAQKRGHASSASRRAAEMKHKNTLIVLGIWVFMWYAIHTPLHS